MIDEIVAFIRARLTEDEEQARDVQSHSPTPWTVAADLDIVLCDHDPTHLSDPDERDTFVAGSEHRQDAEFIARHDPARVLRAVEAKRRVLEGYLSARQWAEDKGCPEHQRQTYRDVATGMYESIRELASEWSTHDDYRQEWKS